MLILRGRDRFLMHLKLDIRLILLDIVYLIDLVVSQQTWKHDICTFNNFLWSVIYLCAFNLVSDLPTIILFNILS